MIRLTDVLRRLNACDDGLGWLASNQKPTFLQLWKSCQRGHDMRWLVLSIAGHYLGTPLCERGQADRLRRTLQDAWFAAEATRPPYSAFPRRLANEIRRRIDGRDIERILYDFAVREGIRPMPVAA